MTKAIKGGGLRPAPQYLLPQECSWQTLPATEDQLPSKIDHDLGPPCGKNAYWVMGCFLEARFYCKKHGQILWNRHHRYRKEHSRRKGANDAIRGKEKGKHVHGSEHTNKQS